MAYHLIIRSDRDDRIYSRETAARLARISLEMLKRCEEEELVKPRRSFGNQDCFTPAEIRQLARIRRLQEDLELDLPAIEVVLYMRQRMVELLQEVGEVEQQMFRRERELYREIRHLRRRLAEEGNWE